MMLRDMLFARLRGTSAPQPETSKFRWRGAGVSRIEGLSDAVFGFAITLLVVSLEVPSTSRELLDTMRGFLSFALTFFALFAVWRTQFTFFRRYGLEDDTTITLTGVLLFVVMFSIYPIKFLLTALIDRIVWGVRAAPGGTTVLGTAIEREHWPWVLLIYGIGFGAVALVFALLHRHAYAQRVELELTDLEMLDTQNAMMRWFTAASASLIVPLVGSVSFIPEESSAAAPATYLVVAVSFAVVIMVLRRRVAVSRRRREFIAALAAASENPRETAAQIDAADW
jgi:low temperature requirement protein LtrA